MVLRRWLWRYWSITTAAPENQTGKLWPNHISAFKEWADEVHSGAWPSAPNLVTAPKPEMDAFKKMLPKKK
jgi:hypothetical protein